MFSAYKKFWTRYADFSGRSSRSDYWWVVLCNFLISLPFSLIAFFGFLIPLFSEIYYAGLYDYEPDLSGAMAGAGLAVFIMFLLTIYWLATIVPYLAITVRRLRDAGFHWAFIFLGVGPTIASFIPVLNILAALVSLPCGIALIVLLCQASKPAQPVNGAPYGQQGFQGQQFGQAQQPVQNQQFAQPGFQGQQQPTQNQQFGQVQQPAQSQQFSQPASQEQPFAQQQAPVQNQGFGQPQQPFGQNQVNQPTQPFAASQAQTQESTQSAFSASVSEPAESVHSVEAHQSQAETAEQALGTASEQINSSESISQ
ncbi:DUF805 domain-containing protein [Streptococcus cristatus]|uniref:DUF805 domain-containing protein n=1 Tax=Streptococcus cristatus ATCC 51100 TaxID=889201 RepID=A0AAV3ECP7_STRCR|nr:DUF805 domain-containing protein [Streptococcus cristatus]EGU66266.1 hypothetical protein HMPREF9960_0516 [Streptococcus cristatus ATCC 51100]KJQ57320.1 hypothetical protein TZ85_01657 [Streptococcus cristatus]SQG32010.1 membrane protein [Streptococcus cristatus ATCC 51100]